MGSRSGYFAAALFYNGIFRVSKWFSFFRRLTPSISVHSLGNKQKRDDNRRSFICQNVDVTKLPPGIDEKKYKKACKGVR
jgi:hypothetical protein